MLTTNSRSESVPSDPKAKRAALAAAGLAPKPLTAFERVRFLRAEAANDNAVERRAVRRG